jgi:Predicted metal-binding protein
MSYWCFAGKVIFLKVMFQAKYVAQFLSESNPGAIGLSVPGMPLGSPGMEVDNRFTPYDVLIHFEDGTSKVYAEIRK